MSDGVTKATRELFAAGDGDISNIDSLRARFYRRQQEQDWLEVESDDEDNKARSHTEQPVKSANDAAVEEDSTIDPLDQFMNTLTASVQQGESGGGASVTGKRKGEVVGDDSEDFSEGLYEHLQKRRKAALDGDAAATSPGQNDDEPASPSNVSSDLQQMMRTIISRPNNQFRSVPPKGGNKASSQSQSSAPARPTPRSDYEEDDDDGEEEHTLGHTSIPANFDWDAMMSQRARPSTLSEIPKVGRK